MTGATTSPVIIGLDVGTTGVKAVAFPLGARPPTMAIREYPLLHPAPGQQVQDPAVVLAAAGSALAACVAALDGAPVLAVSLSAAMHGLLALDPNRRPITPLVTWADGRAGAETTAFLRSGRPGDLQAVTGTPVHPMTPFAKLLWFSRHEPTIWAGARWWIGLKDLLLLWLTGRLATETSSASGTGLLDVTTGRWSPLALAACGLPPDRLPEIVPTTAVLRLTAQAAARLGLPAGTPVAVGAGDGPLANLGTGAIDPGVAGLSLGTSGAIRLAVDGPHPDRTGGLFSYALADPLWVVGGATSNGADVVRWAGRALVPESAAAADSDTAVLDLAASVPAGSDGLVMLPYLFPERAPLWQPALAGAYLGLRHDHTRAHLVRAAVEGVCLQMRLLLDRLEALHPVSAVRATGGAFRSRLWRDLMAAALGRPLWVLDQTEGSALGAAALGLLALDEVASLPAALAVLTGGGARSVQINAAPESVVLFEQLRSAVPELLAALTGRTGAQPAR